MTDQDDEWSRVMVVRRGGTVEIGQANYNRSGLFVQVKGSENLDRLIADLKRARKEMP